MNGSDDYENRKVTLSITEGGQLRIVCDSDGQTFDGLLMPMNLNEGEKTVNEQVAAYAKTIKA